MSTDIEFLLRHQPSLCSKFWLEINLLTKIHVVSLPECGLRHARNTVSRFLSKCEYDVKKSYWNAVSLENFDQDFLCNTKGTDRVLRTYGTLPSMSESLDGFGGWEVVHIAYRMRQELLTGSCFSKVSSTLRLSECTALSAFVSTLIATLPRLLESLRSIAIWDSLSYSLEHSLRLFSWILSMYELVCKANADHWCGSVEADSNRGFWTSIPLASVLNDVHAIADDNPDDEANKYGFDV